MPPYFPSVLKVTIGNTLWENLPESLNNIQTLTPGNAPDEYVYM